MPQSRGVAGEAVERGDPGLCVAVREAFDGLPPEARVESLEELIVDEARVLDGIERFSGLRDLGLEDTDVADIRPLAALKNLARLWLNGTHVSDLRPLSGLGSLTSLELGDTPVADLSPLRSLTRLEKLWLSGTRITDVEPLRSLTGLVTLGLADVAVADYRPLEALTNLQTLVVSRSASDFLGALSTRPGLEIRVVGG